MIETWKGCSLKKEGRNIMSIDWNGGQRITIKGGDTASCTTLTAGQLYCVFFYNSNNTDISATVQVVTDNSTEPVAVSVPGTTSGQGLASLVLLKGSESRNVSVSLSSAQNQAQVDTWIGSVSMPTNTQDITNAQLPLDGKPHQFNQAFRYYAVPPSTWCQLQLLAQQTQFISVQFLSQQATIYICNPTPNPTVNIIPIGSVKEDKDYTVVTPKPGTSQQLITESIIGNGTQWVWMNADSKQNSEKATITLQSLNSMLEP